MECKNFEELLYRDLLISDSMEKNTLKEFPSEERKTLMQIIFPLQTDGLFYNLYHSMTLEGYTGKIISMSQRRLDTGLFQWGSTRLLYRWTMICCWRTWMPSWLCRS